MREKPIVDRVDVVIGEKGDERLITVPKATADRWPDVYRPAETESGNPTAAAKRAIDESDNTGVEAQVPEKKPSRSRANKVAPTKDDGPKSPDELPSAPDPAPATAGVDATAGTSGVTTEGVTS